MARARKVTRPNGQVILIHDDEGGTPVYTYALEDQDIASRAYWKEIDLAEKAQFDTVLKVMREIAFGDATVEAVP